MISGEEKDAVEVSTKTRSNLISNNSSISDKDFWTESHWYWFFFKIYQMTNKGRQLLVNNSTILILKNKFNTLYKIGVAAAK